MLTTLFIKTNVKKYNVIRTIIVAKVMTTSDQAHRGQGDAPVSYLKKIINAYFYTTKE